jgi:hypothetical protein
MTMPEAAAYVTSDTVARKPSVKHGKGGKTASTNSHFRNGDLVALALI